MILLMRRQLATVKLNKIGEYAMHARRTKKKVGNKLRMQTKFDQNENNK